MNGHHDRSVAVVQYAGGVAAMLGVLITLLVTPWALLIEAIGGFIIVWPLFCEPDQ